MEASPFIKSPSFKNKSTARFVMKASQDFIFFGKEWVESFSTPQMEWMWFFKENSLVLKNQNCFSLTLKEENVKAYELLKGVCHLSGICTLMRAYKEEAGPFSVMASPSPSSPFSPWESKALESEQAILNSPYLCSSQKESRSLLSKKFPVVAFSSELFALESFLSFFNDLPKEIQKGVYGPLLPKDLKKHFLHSLDFFYPNYLQGNFPSVKIQVNET